MCNKQNSISKGETRSEIEKVDLKMQKLDLKTERTRSENPKTRFFGLLAQCPPVELRTKKKPGHFITIS